MNKKSMMTTFKLFLQTIMGLLGLLILMAVVKEFLYQNFMHHPVTTTGVAILLTIAVLLGSKKRRDTLVHFVNETLNVDQLLMDDPEEAHIMNQREQKLGEVGSMDLWQ